MLNAALVDCLRRLEPALPDILPQLRWHIADTLAISLAAAAQAPEAVQVIAAQSIGTAGGTCRVIGTTRRLPPVQAAFANAALAHVLDCDDVHDAARLHVTSTTLPAALAAAELVGASGAEVALATALGNEAMCRLGLLLAPTAGGPGGDWFLTQLFGYFGAALAAGLVLKLDDAALVSALGLASMQAAGSKQAGIGTGATARAIYPGFAAAGGVQAALLARAGIRGPEGGLDGAAGLFASYLRWQPDAARRRHFLAPDRWDFSGTAIKIWPCCRLAHPYVAAALAARARQPADATARITLHVSPAAARLCRPATQRCHPATLQDAKFSIPFLVAFTLLRGAPDFENFAAPVLDDTEVSRLAAGMVLHEDLPDRPGLDHARLDFHSPDGVTSITGSLDHAPGEADILRKLAACLRFAGLEPALAPGLAGLDSSDLAKFLAALPIVSRFS